MSSCAMRENSREVNNVIVKCQGPNTEGKRPYKGIYAPGKTKNQKIGKIYHAKNVIGITSGRTNSPELY